jgi:hypothetical protein
VLDIRNINWRYCAVYCDIMLLGLFFEVFNTGVIRRLLGQFCTSPESRITCADNWPGTHWGLESTECKCAF